MGLGVTGRSARRQAREPQRDHVLGFNAQSNGIACN
jgi:hypothetical protein